MIEGVNALPAAKQTGKHFLLDIFVPVRGGPAIHPSFENPDSHRNFTVFQGGETPFKRNKVSEVN